MIELEIIEEVKKKVIDKFNEFRRDIIENGFSFVIKVVLYFKDGFVLWGGLIEGIKKNLFFVKEFKDVVFFLLEGEVSELFEIEFGFYIVMVDKVRG